ncbi:7709_t:CDS:1, partial [Funneliformis geosporum]
TQSEDNIQFENHITFQHFFSIWVDSYGSQSSQSSVNLLPKAMYAELSGLSKKAINSAIRADMQHKLLNIFKAFIYNVQSKLDLGNLTDDINNPVVTKHKG